MFDIHGKVSALTGTAKRGTVHATAQSKGDAEQVARDLRGYGFTVEITGPDGKVLDEEGAA